MSLRSGMNTPAVLVDKYINTAYDDIMQIANILPDIVTVGEYLSDPETAGDITAVADAINGDVAAAQAAASAASASAVTATTQADLAATKLNEFKSIYFGSFASPELVETYLTTNNLSKDTGDLYFNSSSSTMYAWSGTLWTTVGAFSIQQQIHNATVGQTVFGLNNGLTYILGTNNIQVFVNGLLKLKDPSGAPGTQDYQEATNTTIVFNTPMAGTEEVVFIVGGFLSNTQLGVTTNTQVITAVAAQTVVPVNSYVVGIGNINVYKNGVYQPVGQAITESSSTSITFLDALDAGDQIVVRSGDILANININVKAVSTVVTIADAVTTKVVSDVAYIPNNDNIAVYVNGSKQIKQSSYTENANGTDIDFYDVLNEGDKVELVVGNLTSTLQVTEDSASVQYVPTTGPNSNVQDALRTLQGATGSSVVGYTPAGTGAVATTVQNRLRITASDADSIDKESTTPCYAAASYNFTRTTLNCHAVEDWCTLDAPASGLGYASFDAFPTMVGSANHDHLVGVQGRPNFAGSGTLSRYNGFAADMDTLGSSGVIDVAAGVFVQSRHRGSAAVNNLFGVYLTDDRGTGTIGFNAGIVIENRTRGASRYGVYQHVGTNKNFWGNNYHTFNGVIYLGDNVGGFDWETDAANKAMTYGYGLNGTTYAGKHQFYDGKNSLILLLEKDKVKVTGNVYLQTNVAGFDWETDAINKAMTYGFGLNGTSFAGKHQFYDGKNNLILLIDTNRVTLSKPVQAKGYTYATLPTGANGDIIYCSDGRKVGEGPGAGTGVPVYFSNAGWRVFSTDAVVTV
jgi:hypothetical protein